MRGHHIGIILAILTCVSLLVYLQTLAIGAEIMDQYFSCIPACYDFTAVNTSSELSTGEVKKQVDTPIVKETTHLIPEVDDRNDCLAEENPAADLNEEVRQEIRV